VFLDLEDAGGLAVMPGEEMIDEASRKRPKPSSPGETPLDW
jgi:hypothetical protein